MPVIYYAFMLLLIGTPAAAAGGGNDTLFNQVHLEASTQRTIDNDLLEVTLGVEVQGREPARIAGQVNEVMRWALGKAGTVEGVEARTLSYRTHPVYRDQVVTAWRASQQLLLTSGRIAELSELVGVLQEKLQVKRMDFSISPQARRQTENALIGEAMQAFRRRIDAVGEHMDGSEYRIVSLHINTGQPPPVVYRERAMAMSARDTAPPAVEGGTSEVTVTVSGSVQFY